MSVERRLLAACMASRDAYAVVHTHMAEDEWSDAAKLIVSHIDTYYARDPEAKSVSPSTLSNLVQQSLNNPKHKNTFADILESIAQEDVSAVNVVAEVLGAKKEAVSAKISVALATPGATDVQALMDEYRALCESTSLAPQKDEELLSAPSLDALFSENAEEDVIRMMPAALNKRLRGGLMRGHHCVVFARPEMGKTMFIVNLMAGFLRNERKVLYLGNEEPIEDVVVRIVGRMAEMTSREVLENRDRAMQAAEAAGYRNLMLKRLTPGTLREIEELVAKVRPDVLVIDQLRNIQIKEDNMTRSLEKAANGVRQIAGKYKCVAVSVTQAGDSASGKAVLDMGDVDSSNTGIPGACDVMIGIGATQDDERAGRRVLSLAKNKRSGDHSFFPVRVDVSKSKISSMEIN